MKAIKSQQDFNGNIKNILITKQEIHEKIKAAAKKIDEIYDGTPILLVSILKGAFVFLADICRCVTVPCEVAFMKASSYYNGTESVGEVKISLDIEQDISKYHLVLVEDIIDTGRTLNEIVHILKARNPISLYVITLLDKPERRLVDFTPDMSLFTIPDYFVVGYGLDFSEYYRNLPYIAVLDEDKIK